ISRCFRLPEERCCSERAIARSAWTKCFGGRSPNVTCLSPLWPTAMIETTMARPLLALLHVSDSLFPIGGFGYSDGLEAATAAGLVETPADRGRRWAGGLWRPAPDKPHDASC